MAHINLGEVKPSSTTTGLLASDNAVTLGYMTIAGQALYGQAISFQALANQAGGILICGIKSGATPLTSGTTSDVLRRIAPRTNGVDDSWSVGDPGTKYGVNASNYYILPENSGEGVRISLIE